MTLAGRRILVPESRELDLFCRMLAAEGATTLRCPLVAILDLDDPREASAWLDRLIAGSFDDLILLTGEGLRRLVAIADRTGRKAETIAAIGRARTITRGPKPVRALREIGLAPGLSAAIPTSEGVIAALGGEDLRFRHVGVQLYPDAPDPPLLDFLRLQGAEPDPVVPYRYASRIEDGAVADAIRDMACGRIDLVAFTSSPQVRRLAGIAESFALTAELRTGLARTRIAAVGPVVAAALEAIGGRVAVMPESSFHLKPLVAAIRDLFAGTK
jgi:uroporphyrinogen-III synthase